MLQRNRNIGDLMAPFRSGIEWLIFLIASEELPLIVFETLRSNERQNHLKEKGASRASSGQSPHNYGLACDFVIDTNFCDVRHREWNGKMYPDAWDYDSPEPKAAYDRLGDLAKSIGLEWGGDWKFQDVPHVQMPSWKGYIN